MNRVESTPTVSDRVGLELAAKLLRRLLVVYVPIVIEGIVNEGDIVFRVRYEDLKISLTDYKQIPYWRSRLMSNAMSEILIRKHINEFSNLITQIPGNGYDHVVRRFQGRICGLWLEPSAIRLSFHASVLHDALNEHLRDQLESCSGNGSDPKR